MQYNAAHSHCRRPCVSLSGLLCTYAYPIARRIRRTFAVSSTKSDCQGLFRRVEEDRGKRIYICMYVYVFIH